MESLVDQIRNCTLCRDRFRATATSHSPRPVVWIGPTAPILVAGQAPGLQVHKKGRPFDDRSGDRLRDWMGIGPKDFYDRQKVSVLPMAFCFPGYDTAGSDLPPPAICAETWHSQVMAALATPSVRLLVGGYAQTWHLGRKRPVRETVAHWRDFGDGVFPLPHPSWRNTGWLKKNPWFETELLPALRSRISNALETTDDPA